MIGGCWRYFGIVSPRPLFTAKDAKDAKENPKSCLLGFSFASFASFAVDKPVVLTSPLYAANIPERIFTLC